MNKKINAYGFLKSFLVQVHFWSSQIDKIHFLFTSHSTTYKNGMDNQLHDSKFFVSIVRTILWTAAKKSEQ